MSLTINAKRKAEGKLGVPAANDVASLVTRARAKKRDGLSEEAVVGKVIQGSETRNPCTSFKSFTDQSGKLEVW